MGETITKTTTPRIYVACLAAYNSGILHGRQVDAAQEAWAIYDYEGFGGARIGEYAGFDSVAELAAFIVEHGEIGAALLDHFNGDNEEAREARDAELNGDLFAISTAWDAVHVFAGC
jgi:antirestriction protein